MSLLRRSTRYSDDLAGRDAALDLDVALTVSASYRQHDRGWPILEQHTGCDGYSRATIAKIKKLYEPHMSKDALIKGLWD